MFRAGHQATQLNRGAVLLAFMGLVMALPLFLVCLAVALALAVLALAHMAVVRWGLGLVASVAQGWVCHPPILLFPSHSDWVDYSNL
jgi:hypothetical protein